MKRARLERSGEDVEIESRATLLGWLLEVDGRTWLENVLGQGLTLTGARLKESENDAWMSQDDERATARPWRPYPFCPWTSCSLRPCGQPA